MRVRDLMVKNIITVMSTMTIVQAAIFLNETHADEAFVVNKEGNIIGYISKSGFIKALAMKDRQEIKVQDIMDHEWAHVPCAMTIKQLAQEFDIYRYNFFLVVDTQNSPIGILRTIDVAKYLSQESLSRAAELQTVVAELENVKNLKRTLESAIESIFENIVIVDEKGIITMINQCYCEFLGVEAVNVVGKRVVDVIPNTRMHVVAQGGKAEIAHIQRINENNCVVTRIPIVKDGQNVGAVGKVIFKDVKDLKTPSNKLHKLQFEVEYYKEELRKVYGGKYTFDHIIGDSEKMQWTKTIGIKAAKGNSTVLILGESGTGKELFAHSIHNESPRRKGPFIRVNCAAVPENLLESELFGYDEGAFTGAKRGGKLGKFELANSGTIFLDEIGDMSLYMQARMLRVLQEKEFERVGGTKTIKLDLRIIAATNRDLEKMIEEGKFRHDLYYRLNIISLTICPLRERVEDIPMLCNMLLKKINNQAPHCVEGVSTPALQLLMHYTWPGNVRELENILERAINLMDDDEFLITPEGLPPVLKKVIKVKDYREITDNLSGLLGDTERQAIIKALESTGGNRSDAAKILGIHRSGFYQKLRKYDIQ